MSRGPWLEADGLTFRYGDGDTYRCADAAEVVATCEMEARLWTEAAERFEWEAGREWHGRDARADFSRLAASSRENAATWAHVGRRTAANAASDAERTVRA